MSQLKVEIVEIESVEPHPNADRLDIAKIKGMDWRVVIGKGSFSVGNPAIYFPVDSLLPANIESVLFPIDSKIRLTNSRIRTIKLRGAVSQGMLVRPEVLSIDKMKLGTDLTAKLGVEKYEPPAERSPQGTAVGKSTRKQSNPAFRRYTSIENGKNYPNLFREDEWVSITEKLHGTNFRAGYVPFFADTWWKKIKQFFRLTPKYEFVYGSHNVQLQSKMFYKGYYDSNVYAEAVVKYDLANKLQPGEVLYGEIVGPGVQKNYAYGCKQDERKLVAFDLMVDGAYLNFLDFQAWAIRAGIEPVPELYRGPFNLAAAKALTQGNSVYAPEQKIREGVVVKPLQEELTYMGRKILKLISDDYLLRNDVDDWH